MATIKDIARLAGLDISTVSRALNESTRVTDATRKRVKEMAEKLGYHKNEIARSLVTRKTKIIGLIVPDISNPFFAEVTKGVELAGSRSGYNIILCDSNWDGERAKEHLRILRGKQADGIILCFIQDFPDPGARELKASGTPWVEIGSSSATDDSFRVSIDNEKGAFAATAYLTSLGHRKIAHVTGDIRHTQKSYWVLIERLTGYRRALREAAIRFDERLVVDTLAGVQSAQQNITKLLRRNPAVTAIFATSDVMALGAYRAAHELGLSIPGDLSVVGFDDIEVASILKPALTTYEQPRSQLGMAATKMLVDLIGGGTPSKRSITLESRGLIIRESCSPPVGAAAARRRA